MRSVVLGVGFDNLTLSEAADTAMRIICSGRRGAYVATPNPEIVWICRHDAEAAEAVAGADMVIADGIGVVRAAAILKRPLKERVAGADLAMELIRRLSVEEKSVFLLGAEPGTAERAAENLLRDYPGLRIAGMNDGFFSEDAPVIAKINAVRPDLLVVCLGAPKQEKWMAANASVLDVGLMVGLGGLLDVLSGRTEKAHEKWRKLGLEWAYRLIKDPGRIKRDAVLPLFMLRVLGERISGK